MRCFLFYIDDWLSSKAIEKMDALEELGFLYLLIRQAADETCTLPDDDDELSILSRLGRQWFKPTKDREKRIGDMTSGNKLRREFDPHEGRLFNARMYREWNHQKEVAARRSQNGSKGGRPRKLEESNSLTNGKQSETNYASRLGLEVSGGGAEGDLFEGQFLDELERCGVTLRQAEPEFRERVVEIARHGDPARSAAVFSKLMRHPRFKGKGEGYVIAAFKSEVMV